MGEIIARTAIEPHLRAVLASNDAEAVMLDFVQPLAVRLQLVGFGWETRPDEPGREGTLQHVGLDTVGQRLLQLKSQGPLFFAKIVLVVLTNPGSSHGLSFCVQSRCARERLRREKPRLPAGEGEA